MSGVGLNLGKPRASTLKFSANQANQSGKGGDDELFKEAFAGLDRLSPEALARMARVADELGLTEKEPTPSDELFQAAHEAHARTVQAGDEETLRRNAALADALVPDEGTQKEPTPKAPTPPATQQITAQPKQSPEGPVRKAWTSFLRLFS